MQTQTATDLYCIPHADDFTPKFDPWSVPPLENLKTAPLVELRDRHPTLGLAAFYATSRLGFGDDREVQYSSRKGRRDIFIDGLHIREFASKIYTRQV